MNPIQTITRTGRVIFFVTALGFMTGCAHQYGPDAQFGQSIREHLALQTKNPGGVGHNRLTSSFEGGAARSSVDAYLKSFDAPKPTQDALKLGIGVVREGNGTSK
jgi:hypothetical protein